MVELVCFHDANICYEFRILIVHRVNYITSIVNNSSVSTSLEYIYEIYIYIYIYICPTMQLFNGMSDHHEIFTHFFTPCIVVSSNSGSLDYHDIILVMVNNFLYI